VGPVVSLRGCVWLVVVGEVEGELARQR